MTPAAMPERYRSILEDAAASGRRSTVLIGAVVAVCVLSLALTGFFDVQRLVEGAPALAQLADEMVPPDFSRLQSWLKPLLDTLAMSIAGTALAVVLSLPLALLIRYDQVAAILLTILACVVVVDSTGAALRKRLK